MKCPACGSLDTLVFDSRPHDGTIRRRRRCRGCEHRWSTIERFEGLRQRRPNKGRASLIERERVPPGTHRAVQFFFEEKIRQNVSYEEIGRAALMSSRGMMCWGESSPAVNNLEAALNVLGYELHARKKTGGTP